MPPISQQLYKFSPVAEIIVRNLGMEDKNGNGVIDKDSGEGYEQFTEKYGNADTGFHANRVVYGNDNSRLEENEIVNHYYINIRFKNPEETTIIENEIENYVYANNVPLIWQDDEQGTATRFVARILRNDNWNNSETPVTEDEAVKMLGDVMSRLRITGRTGSAGNTGYYDLPGFINRRAGYCFEVAQFGFWFFSELKLNSIVIGTSLKAQVNHQIIRLYANSENTPNTNIDYFGSSDSYNIPEENWNILNPLQAYSMYYEALAQKEERSGRDSMQYRELAITYDKYDINTIGMLIQTFADDKNHAEVIELGRFILENMNLDEIINSTALSSKLTVNNLEEILLTLLESYSITNNATEFSNIENKLMQYYMGSKSKYTETKLQGFINSYRRNLF